MILMNLVILVNLVISVSLVILVKNLQDWERHKKEGIYAYMLIYINITRLYSG